MQPLFYTNNRQALVKKLQGGLIILTAYTQMQRGNDAAFKFEQEANFWYLTGIEHPGWTVIIDGTTNSEWLIAPDTDSAHELFDGSLSFEEASVASGIKKIVSHDEGQSLLRGLAKRHSMVSTIDLSPHADHFSFTVNPAIRENKQRLERLFASVRDCNKELAGLRAIKHPEEITAIKQAINLTTKAFEEVRSRFDAYVHEYEIEADFTHRFRSRGAAGHAYDPIVAAGNHACTLHYGDNSAKLKRNQLVLIDVGARLNGYAADITRTYVYRSATKRQLAVHAAVERTHTEIVSLLKPGLAVEEYSRTVDNIMKRALMELGLLSDMSDDATYRRYFPHAISHGLGIDVHDSLGGPRIFSAGMVLTVEPGIYIPEENIGVRIEDDILITDKGHQNLSRGLSTAA